MKKLTKEQVYVLIDNQPDCDRAIEIFRNYPSRIKLIDDKKYLILFPSKDEIFEPLNTNRTQVTLDDLERILMPKIKKAELLDRIEKLEEYVKELIDNPKVTIVHPPTWANDPSTVIGKWAEIIEEPQYQAGTLGAFWDGEWNDAVDGSNIHVGYLEYKKDDMYKSTIHFDTWQNFKPLKFD